MKRASRAKWAERVRQWKSSGLTAQEFAGREGLNKTTLVWWSSRLRREQPTPAFIEVKLPPSRSDGAGTVVEIELRDGTRLRVGSQVDTSHLQRVLAALEGR